MSPPSRLVCVRRLFSSRALEMPAIPNLFVLPFGTALGIYAMWVLLHDEARKMFVKELAS